MWILASICSAFFAGLTAILSKCGLKNCNNDVANAIRTSVVLIFAWLIVFILGLENQIQNINLKSFIFIILSSIATGLSWISYFKALSIGEVTKVAAIDKSSVILSILFAIILFPEERKLWVVKLILVFIISIGTFLMIDIKHEKSKSKYLWLLFAFLSALFASFTSILAKIGIENVDSNLATAIRTIVIFIISWLIVVFKKENKYLKKIKRREIIFLIFSGIATGLSWLSYYYALRFGKISVVVSIDKLSILVTICFSLIVFKEKLSIKALCGLIFIIIGTILIAII